MKATGAGRFGLLSEALRALLFSRRAHLLTTRRWRAVVSLPLVGSCALRGGCGCCDSRMDNATLLRNCCHCPRSWRSALRRDCRTFSCNNVCQLPSKSFHRKIFDVMGIAPATPIFFLRKRNKNEEEGTVRVNGDLSSGSKSCQSWRRPIRCCRRCIYELLPNSQ